MSILYSHFPITKVEVESPPSRNRPLFSLSEKNTTFVTRKQGQMNSDEYYMKQALVEAQKAFDREEIPIGAVVVCNKRIIARAHNLTETLNDVTAHAEMQAITAAASFLGGKYLINCTLYVTVEPCPMCAGALGWAQISKIVYGAADEKRGYRKFAPEALHPKTEVVSGVRAGEAAGWMKQFFQNKR
jgi:tRNA(adenine34) deaminase